MNPLAIGAAVVIAALSALYGYERVQHSHAEVLLKTEQRDREVERGRLVQENFNLSQQYRAKETAWRQDQEKHDAETATKTEALQRDVARLGASHDDLLRYATALARASRSAPADPAAQPGSPPADAPGDVLAQLLRRVDGFAGGVAEYADRARIAGERCVVDYNTLIGPPP
jgi:hypothetical protein